MIFHTVTKGKFLFRKLLWKLHPFDQEVMSNSKVKKLVLSWTKVRNHRKISLVISFVVKSYSNCSFRIMNIFFSFCLSNRNISLKMKMQYFSLENAFFFLIGQKLQVQAIKPKVEKQENLFQSVNKAIIFFQCLLQKLSWN